MASLLLAATPAYATPAEDDLAEFLRKNYNKSGGLLDALLPNAPTGYAADYEGQQTDGSYWTSAYFNALNVATAGWPQRTLSKYCAKAKGTLVQSYAVRVFDNGIGSGPITLADPNGDTELAVDRWMIERWRYGAWQSEQKSGPREWDLRSPAGLIDAKGFLGLFSCHDESGKSLWHVAILPTRFGNMQALQEVGRSANAWFMLSIRPVTATEIAKTAAEKQAVEEKERAAQLAINDQWKREAAVREEQGAKRAALLVSFRKSLTVGTKTNCGRVLAFNGPLVEVQVPSHVQLRNSATRVFVERDKLEPDDAEAWNCKWD
ncbi:hypothetical protein ACFSAG_09540 [Sphingorhabdus buctiana]|uniref:Uncharacterized protein n=1 Tax=Sphingorhabdus buctiana TaxID=1508805 RepID=A0ABW4MDG7_9SPHN